MILEIDDAGERDLVIIVSLKRMKELTKLSKLTRFERGGFFLCQSPCFF